MNNFNVHDTILYPITYEDLVLMAQNINPANGDISFLLREELYSLLKSKVDECLELFDEDIEDIMNEAFPEEEGLQRDPEFSEETCDNMAKEIYEFLLKYEMWMDVCIYYNGKRMTTSSGGEYRYNRLPFIEEDKNPQDYFGYVRNPHILSMSFEGTFCACLNGNADAYGWDIEKEFNEILSKYGCYYELGHHWNLTCYPI